MHRPCATRTRVEELMSSKNLPISARLAGSATTALIVLLSLSFAVLSGCDDGALDRSRPISCESSATIA